MSFAVNKVSIQENYQFEAPLTIDESMGIA